MINFEAYEEAPVLQLIEDEDIFERLEKKAEALLKKLTFSRITTEDGVIGQLIRDEFTAYTDEQTEAVTYGLCELINALYMVETARQDALSGATQGNIRSVSSGGESISYGAAETSVTEALRSAAAEQKMYRDALMTYMRPEMFEVNPFYAGI